MVMEGKKKGIGRKEGKGRMGKGKKEEILWRQHAVES